MKLPKKLAMTLALSSCCLNLAATLPVSAENKSAQSQMSYKEQLKAAVEKINSSKQTLGRGTGSDDLSEAHTLLARAEEGATAAHDDATLADVYLAMADYRFQARSLSMEEVDKALKIRERLYGKNSTKTAEAMNKTAYMATWVRDYTRARDLFNSSIEIMDANKGAGAKSLGEALELSAQQGLTNRTGDVAKVFRRALVSMRKYLAKDDPAIISCLTALGVASQGRSPGLKDDEPDYLAEAAALLKNKTPNDPKVATVLESQAKEKSNRGKPKEAVEAYRGVISIREKDGTSPIELARTYEQMSSYLASAGAYPEGEQFIKKALALYEKNPGSSNLALINGLNHAISYFESGPKPETAIQYYEKRAAMKDRFQDEPKGFAELCLKLKKYDRAIPLLKQCLAHEEKESSGRDISYDAAEYCLKLGIACTELGQLTEAEKYFLKSKATYEKSTFMKIPWYEAYTRYLLKAGKKAEYGTYKAKLEKLRQTEARICPACGMG